MTSTDLVDRLAAHSTLGVAPRDELAWLASHGSLRHLKTGEGLIAKGHAVDGLWVVLSGRISIFVDRGAGLQKMIEWRAGDVTGLLPYSRLTSAPGDSFAQEPTEILALHRDRVPDMIQRSVRRSRRSSCTRCSTARACSRRAICTTRKCSRSGDCRRASPTN